MTDRGTSLTLGYVLSLSIATVLVTGLLIAGGGFVDERRDQVVREELRVIGQHVASNVEKADRLVVAGDDVDTVAVNQSFPRAVTGAQYNIHLVPASSGSDHLFLNSSSQDIAVRVNVTTETDLRETTANGGTVAVVYDSNELVIRNG